MAETRPPPQGRPVSGIRIWLLIGAALVILGTIALIWLLYLSRPAPPALP
jgi:hypothetical protein